MLITDQVAIAPCTDCVQARRPTFGAKPVEGALHKKCRYTNQSANGAEYDSQGQARSASPLVCDNCQLTRPERPK